MSDELELLVRTEAKDPAEETLVRVADLLGASVQTDSDGLRGVHRDGLLVHAVVPDAEDQETARRIFDLETNLTLVFVDLTATGGDPMILEFRGSSQHISC